MDEDSRISSSNQPSTSFTSGPTAVIASMQKTSTVLKKCDQTQEQPSTSRSHKSETREFGYTDALPFAPWRRKRYGLTVQGLHEEIVDMYHWIKPNEIESRLRTKVYEKVRASVLQRWQHKPIKISMFGSLRTNLFLPTSDIDVLVECDDWVGSPGDWLTETANGLEQDNIAESVMVYKGAFVPIVKMVDRDTRLSIDISFNTVQGVRAASYIAKVKEEFPLIEPLVLLLKQFLHYRNLNQTFTGGLSSYGLVLLLVNFFQLYALNMRHRTIYDRGVNLGHLLLRFLELYSLEFNYEEMGISPGQCCYIPKSAAGARYGHKRAQPGNLALEDPLLTANDVGRSTYNFSSIANAFGQAFQILVVAVTMRERKGRNQLAKVYKGSLLHMIMPFTSKELTYRNWLMSGVLSLPSQETSVTYDLNQLHNTLVSPMVDLSRYAWLRKAPAGAEKRDSRPLKITNPADDVKNQVLLQLKLKEEKESKEIEAERCKKLIEKPISAVKELETEEEDVGSECVQEKQEENDNGLILTGPPLPTSTASVNTSATVSTAASISEREDTDSPGLSSSLGTQSSSEEDDDSVNNAGKSSTGVVSVQFKKQFSEVVKTPKEFSKKTQTNFDDRKTGGAGKNGHQFMNNHLYYQDSQPTSSRRNGFVDYAAAVASSGGHKHRQTYGQRNRQSRNHSHGSDASDGYDADRKSSSNNNSARARRGIRVSSNSSNRSRHSSESRSRGRPSNSSCFSMPPSADFHSRRSQYGEASLTDESGHGSALTSTSEEPRSPRMYADAVKKKSSVSCATSTSVDLNLVNGNLTKNGIVSQNPVSGVVSTTNNERSYRNAVVIPSSSHPAANSSTLSSQSARKDNDVGFDRQSLNGNSSDTNRLAQLAPMGNRLPR